MRSRREIQLSYNKKFANNRRFPLLLKFRVRRRETVTFFPAKTGRIIGFFYSSHLFSCFGHKCILYLHRRTQYLVPLSFQTFLWLEGRGIALDKGGEKVSVLTAVFACVSAALGAKGGGPPLLSVPATTLGTEVS